MQENTEENKSGLSLEHYNDLKLLFSVIQGSKPLVEASENVIYSDMFSLSDNIKKLQAVVKDYTTLIQQIADTSIGDTFTKE